MKKLFRLTALATMVSLVATISVTTSCSDDDDDENDNKNNPAVVDTTKNDTVVPPEQTDTVPVVNQEEVFVLEVGGSKSKASSFISIQNKRTYTVSEVIMSQGSGIEIVFDGSMLFSASGSANEVVRQNGCAAVLIMESDKVFKFVTSCGENGKDYSGKIEVIEGEMKGADSTIKIKVTRYNKN